MSQSIDIPFQKLLDALLNVDTPLKPRLLYRLSDLENPEVEQLAAVWPKMPLWRRQALMEDIAEMSDSDTLLSFEALCRFAVQDADPKVRLLAVYTLWDYEENNLIPLYSKLLETDADAGVRSAAASALGRYIYLGESEEIPAKRLRKIEELLLSVVQGQDAAEVRRSALESLGYSSRDEVRPLIEAAYASQEKEWVASALFAMGRSGELIWQPQVLEMLESKLPLLRCDAARAAGELEIAAATPLLMELLEDPDSATRLASVWSLSQIGGEGVRQAIEGMYEQAEDEHETEALEAALDNLDFNESMQLMPMLDFPEFAEDEEDDGTDLDFVEEDNEPDASEDGDEDPPF